MSELPVGEVIEGDALEVMRGWPAGSVDAVVTDCPYGTGGWFRTETGLGSGMGHDHHCQEEWDEWDARWLTEALRVARTVVTFLPQTRIAETWNLRVPARLLLWCKPDPRPAFSIMHAFEPILAFGPLQGVWSMDYALHSAIKPNRNSEALGHPHQKPVAVMQWLVRLACPQGGVVMDCFAGSGSTLEACIREGRRFVGVELDPHWAEVARERVARAQRAFQQGFDFGPQEYPDAGANSPARERDERGET